MVVDAGTITMSKLHLDRHMERFREIWAKRRQMGLVSMEHVGWRGRI